MDVETLLDPKIRAEIVERVDEFNEDPEHEYLDIHLRLQEPFFAPQPVVLRHGLIDSST